MAHVSAHLRLVAHDKGVASKIVAQVMGHVKVDTTAMREWKEIQKMLRQVSRWSRDPRSH